MQSNFRVYVLLNPQTDVTPQGHCQLASLDMQESENGDKDCCVSLEQLKNMIFYPCSHMVVCKGCCKLIMRQDRLCPICRNTIAEAFPGRF